MSMNSKISALLREIGRPYQMYNDDGTTNRATSCKGMTVIKTIITVSGALGSIVRQYP